MVQIRNSIPETNPICFGVCRPMSYRPKILTPPIWCEAKIAITKPNDREIAIFVYVQKSKNRKTIYATNRI